MERPEDAALTRERPLEPKRTCLLMIDTQGQQLSRHDEMERPGLRWSILERAATTQPTQTARDHVGISARPRSASVFPM